MNIKVTLLGLVLILLTACGGLKQETTETTYLNLDFEETLSNGDIKYWNTSGRGFTISVDGTEKYSGKSSLHIAGKSINKSFGLASSSFPMDPVRGKKIRFSGYIKTEGVTDGHAGLWWRVDTQGRRATAYGNTEKQGGTGTAPWKEYVIELDIPAEEGTIAFGLYLSGSGKAWFDHFQVFINGEPYKQVKPVPIVPTQTDLAWIRANAIPFKSADPTADHTELMPLKEIIGDRYIAALGEGTHGTGEFFKMKHRLTRFLVEEMGFTIFAIEANMPEARKVNRYILTGEGDPKEALAGLYFWTWNTGEVLAMIEWMREYNKSGKGRIEFYGFDMQFPPVAMESVTAFVKKADPNFLEAVENHYKPVKEMYEVSTKSLTRSGLDYEKWYKEAKMVYDHLTANREVYIKSFDAPEVDWAIQDANVVLQGAEGSIQGKRSRDRSMAENLEWVLAHSPKGTKVVTWAHNGHVSRHYNYFESMGSFLHKRHGDGMIVFAFAFHEGTYTARGSKGIDVYGTSSSEPNSVEWFLKSSGIPNLILDLRKVSEGKAGSQWLNRELDFRSIGSVASDYAFSKRKITREFDVLIYFEKTTPTHCFR